MSVPVRLPVKSEIMESVLLNGDLSKMTPDERVRYYGEVCNSMGLNPLTKPFEFITLNSKLQLYALRSCTDQLRKINGVTLEIVSRDIAHDILTIHVRAKLPDGRTDEDLGTVPFPDTLKGEARANAELKAVTKAKRRATLSICGLGWLDETEVEDIPRRPQAPVPTIAISNGSNTIDAEQAQNLRDKIKAAGASETKFLTWAKVNRIEDIAADLYESCCDAILNASKQRVAS